MSGWADEYLTLIDDCEARESRLTNWQRGFLDSIREQLRRDRPLSLRQSEKLDEIWEQATKAG